MKFPSITTHDTTILKGLAILMILFHNFFHWVSPAPGENEMIYNYAFTKNFISSLFIVPEYSIQTIFSYFGHYGVQIFMFLSAYGLTKKYLNSEKIQYFSFLKRRTIKIYIPFLISIVVWAIYVTLFGWTWGQETGLIELLKENAMSLIYKLTLVANFVPGELFAINGPWWFVSLIFQFYLIFPFLLNLAKEKDGDKYLLYISVAALLYSAIIMLVTKTPPLLYGTILPHLPEFALGIYFAKQKEIHISNKIFFTAIIMVILGSFIKPLWFFSSISMLIILLVLFFKIKNNLSKISEKFIMEVGVASMFIFYINGFMRNPFVQVADHYTSWWGTILIGLIFFTVVLFFAMILTRVNDYIDKKIL